MYTLYTIPGSCSTGIHAFLNALNIPVEIVKRDDVSNYQALVPTNQVPALSDGGNIITEGAAIAQYLVKKHGIGLPTDATSEDYNHWLMFCYATLHPAYGKLYSTLVGMEDSDAKQAFYEYLAANVTSLWQIVDSHLKDKPFIMGTEVTVMDYLIAIYASWGTNFPSISIKLGKNVRALIERVKQLPEFTLAYAKEGATHAIPANA